MTVAMRLGWLVATLVMLVICLITAYEATLLALFDRLGPGPGFFPFWLAALGAALCLAILAQVFRTAAETGNAAPIFPRGGDLAAVIAVLACLVIPPLLMDFLGYRLAMTIFATVLVAALGERRIWAIALFAVVAGFGTFHVFNNWLDVILPVGVFGI